MKRYDESNRYPNAVKPVGQSSVPQGRGSGIVVRCDAGTGIPDDALGCGDAHQASLVELTRDLGISACISCLIGADDVEKAKPHPEPVLKVLSALGFSAADTLVVGDMNVDILMGRNAGTKTCGVTYGNGTRQELEEAGADYVIDGIDALLDII